MQIVSVRQEFDPYDRIYPAVSWDVSGGQRVECAARAHEKRALYVRFVDTRCKYGAINFLGRVVKRLRKVLFLTDHEIPGR